jgi:hypothetical protein
MVAAVNASRASRAAMARTVPTTPAGLSALTYYVAFVSLRGQEFLFEEADTFDFIKTLRTATRH